MEIYEKFLLTKCKAIDKEKQLSFNNYKNFS